MEYYDLLYEEIKTNGYKSQREICSCEYYCRCFDEILVNITRDGMFLLEDSLHRTFIAKILGLNTVPVRVFIRHQRWQKYRDQMFESQGRKVSTDHPDLQFGD